ncbi:ABC transporter permease [Nonomuraea sp. NPDC050394]|uniref:ABC transporter permease n=1 Tax=Nonomuraea sp. NPDC050394 TaxID=3364363 RepID=UPI0037B65B62
MNDDLATAHEPVTSAAAVPERGRTRSWRAELTRLAFPLSLVVLLAIGFIGYPGFRTAENFLNILTFSAILFIVAVGQTFVVIGRGVDLSVGSMLGLSGAVFATLVVSGWSTPVAILASLALGVTVGGVVHGLLITKLRMSFMIVTLGTLALLSSQTQVILNGQSVTVDSSFLDTLANGRLWGVPNIVLLAGALYLAGVMILRRTVYGRSLFAVGSNPDAARLAGVPVDRVTIIAYGLCGLFAALAGILTVGQLGSAQPTGSATELTSITAVLLGGTGLFGGYGSITRTLFGVVYLGVLENLLSIAGVSSFWQGTASGFVLIAAVAVDRTRRP